ncbi:hypothetical protein C5167_014419 [Papaver somniferum]|uniref:Transposase MuDR plant domain-containing protein n=1 Tax=Papaver somniferum TaxID=3469 RepID=A0A4Y7J671_PAPSO|nr:hypothetical protein C5167_014419 [Papaver somniferum]
MVGIGACFQGRDGSSMVMCIAVMLNCAAGRTEDAAVRSPSAAEFDGNLKSVVMDVVSCIVVVRYFSNFITIRVNVETKLDEFKEQVCKELKQFTPLGICFFFREGGKEFPVDCDSSFQSLASISHSKKKTSVDIFLQNVTHVASSSSSRAASFISDGSSTSSSRNNFSVAMYLEDKSKPAKPLLSDGWPKVLGEIGHVFVEGVKQVRIAYTKYRLRTGFNMVVTYNERSGFTAKCAVKECGWKFHAASIDERNEMFQYV